jgi:hypothetical protein
LAYSATINDNKREGKTKSACVALCLLAKTTGFKVKVTVSGTLQFDIEEAAAPGFQWTIKLQNGVIIKNPMSLILPIDHQVTASIQPVDAKGNPAAIDGLATWGVSDPAILTVTNISTDTLSADVVPTGALGTAQVNVTADADLGTGIATIHGTLDVQIVAGQAVGFTINTAPAVPIPAKA